MNPDVYKDKLFAFLEAQEENMIADLKEFVRIPSISTDLAEVRRALDYALSLGEKNGVSAAARSSMDRRGLLKQARDRKPWAYSPTLTWCLPETWKPGTRLPLSRSYATAPSGGGAPWMTREPSSPAFTP